jgi:hypothetical protein
MFVPREFFVFLGAIIVFDAIVVPILSKNRVEKLIFEHAPIVMPVDLLNVYRTEAPLVLIVLAAVFAAGWCVERDRW